MTEAAYLAAWREQIRDGKAQRAREAETEESYRRHQVERNRILRRQS